MRGRQTDRHTDISRERGLPITLIPLFVHVVCFIGGNTGKTVLRHWRGYALSFLEENICNISCSRSYPIRIMIPVVGSSVLTYAF